MTYYLIEHHQQLNHLTILTCGDLPWRTEDIPPANFTHPFRFGDTNLKADVHDIPFPIAAWAG